MSYTFQFFEYKSLTKVILKTTLKHIDARDVISDIGIVSNTASNDNLLAFPSLAYMFSTLSSFGYAVMSLPSLQSTNHMNFVWSQQPLSYIAHMTTLMA